jgi:hypothetical protein
MAAPVVKPELDADDYYAWLVEQAAHLRAQL